MNAPAKIEVATIYSAMAAAFAEIGGATKSSTGQVGQQKYKYADLTGVIEAIKPALSNHGLFFIQRPEPCERGITIETIVGHAGGEQMSLGTLFVPANRNDAQGYGSALTYARRYALVTAFGVPVEDDDGNAVTSSQRVAQAAPKQDGPPTINDAQWAEITTLIETTHSDLIAFCKLYEVGSVKELTAEKYANAKDKLNKKLAGMKAKKDAEAAKANSFGDILDDEIPAFERAS